MRTLIIIASAFVLTSASGCDTARGQQEKADQAQADANQKVADANREANQKATEAQAQADKQIADAQLTFTKLREDYRHDVTTKLAELDKKIADLEAKEKTLPPAKRAPMEAKLGEVRRSREVFTSDYRGIETASASTWDDFKKRLDKSWSELETKVNNV